MIKDFVPARTSLSTGITISSPVLERNKWSYANPSSTDEIEVMGGNLEGPIITTEYTDIYQGLTGSKAAYYTGEFSGSIIKYGDDWIERNFNPYLYPTASLTSSLNAFNHSEFNVLLNNVSASRLSLTRQNIEFIYGTTGSILAPAYLQDTNESLTTYNRARYEGAKVSSLLYSVYTSASTDYAGDSSYGKTAAINKDVRKIGLFTEIESSFLLPGRNRVALKYLVDEFGGLTELNQRNKHWEDVQRTFIAGGYLNVSQFDNQKSSNQKSTDGNKLIFDSGYSYNPILYFVTCSATDPKIYFENLSGASSYRATAKNGTLPLTISGSSPLGYPISASYVPNIFNTLNDTAGAPYFSVGTLNSHPSYSVQETGEHNVQASFDMTVELVGTNQSATWSFQVFKNDEVSPLYEAEQIFSTTDSSTVSRRVFINYYSISPSSIINVTNNTNANTTNITGGSTGNMFITVPNNGTVASVTFNITKTTPSVTAVNSGGGELFINSTAVSAFPIDAGSPLTGSLTGNIDNDDTVRIDIYEV
jgi:hypothetical protein